MSVPVGPWRLSPSPKSKRKLKAGYRLQGSLCRVCLGVPMARLEPLRAATLTYFTGEIHAARTARVLGSVRDEYGRKIHDSAHQPRRTARQLARAVDGGRRVGAALRHLDGHGSEPEALAVAEALARFLVARCDSRHAGRRIVRQVIVDSEAGAPWEKCARRAVPLVAEDLISRASDHERTPLSRAQHIAARRRAEQIAVHVDQTALLADLGLIRPRASPERWRVAMTSAVEARSREQVARAVDRSLSD
jgi:hypothetical protein